jgi:hypothetical protein
MVRDALGRAVRPVRVYPAGTFRGSYGERIIPVYPVAAGSARGAQGKAALAVAETLATGLRDSLDRPILGVTLETGPGRDSLGRVIQPVFWVDALTGLAATYGPEMVANNSFDSGTTGWSLSAGTVTWGASGGNLNITGVSVTGSLQATMLQAAIVGQRYRTEWDLTAFTGSNTGGRAQVGGQQGTNTKLIQTHAVDHPAAVSMAPFRLALTSGFIGVVGRVSCRRILQP